MTADSPLGTALVATADEELSGSLAASLAAMGYSPLAVPLSALPDELGPASVILVAPTSADGEAMGFAQQVRGSVAFQGTPLIWVTGSRDRDELQRCEDLFDDFLEVPYSNAGLEARLRLARRRSGKSGESGDPGQQEVSEILQRGGLVMNLSTYQVSVERRPLELTYMEHQLLRFLVSSPRRVHTREAILQNVWGYDYYGGIRTVDVHVRRLRAKLGQEHAWLIETVRSVGYRFAADAR